MLGKERPPHGEAKLSFRVGVYADNCAHHELLRMSPYTCVVMRLTNKRQLEML
jgi:hypothetical protein